MGRLTPQIIQLIQAEDPDIITAQEVYSCDGPVIFPDNMFDCYQQVAKLGYEHSFLSPVWSMQIAHQTAEFGTAIFSKFPIDSQNVFFTNGSFVSDLTPETHIPNSRNAQIATLSVGHQNLTIVNHHGYWEINPEGSETSVEKMQIVADKVREQSGPIIMAGDLNVNPGTPAMHVFDGLLEDLTATHNIPSTLSVLGKVPNVSCDHILINSDIAVNEFTVCEELVSDHKALILDFDIK